MKGERIMYFTVIFCLLQTISKYKRKKLDCMAKKLFACTQAWHSLGLGEFFLNLFARQKIHILINSN